jgi:hypothetical protein
MKDILKDTPIELFPSLELTDQGLPESSDTDKNGRKRLFIENLPQGN